MAGPPVARTAHAPPSATRSAYETRPSAAEPRSSAFTVSSTRQPRCEQPQAHLGSGDPKRDDTVQLGVHRLQHAPAALRGAMGTLLGYENPKKWGIGQPGIHGLQHAPAALRAAARILLGSGDPK